MIKYLNKKQYKWNNPIVQAVDMHACIIFVCAANIKIFNLSIKT